jgi:cytoskeleton protein RodZ
VAVELKWVGRSWVEVKVDGKLVLEGILSSGASREFSGREVEVSAGNAGGVKLVVDGRDLGLFGRYGEVVTRTYRPKP